MSEQERQLVDWLADMEEDDALAPLLRLGTGRAAALRTARAERAFLAGEMADSLVDQEG